MGALLHIARTVRGEARNLTAADVQAALDSGATDGDVQLAVLIAAAFSMFNRMVDGLRAQTPPPIPRRIAPGPPRSPSMGTTTRASFRCPVGPDRPPNSTPRPGYRGFVHRDGMRDQMHLKHSVERGARVVV